MTPAEVCARQSEIIKMQSDIIDDLFLQLLQYVTIDEEEKELEMMQTVINTQKNAL